MKMLLHNVIQVVRAAKTTNKKHGIHIGTCQIELIFNQVDNLLKYWIVYFVIELLGLQTDTSILVI